MCILKEFRVFGISFSLLGGRGFGTLWVGGPRRGFGKYQALKAGTASVGLGCPRSTVGKRPQSIESYEREWAWNRTISTVLWVNRKLPPSTVKQVLPSNEGYESRTGCNRTLAAVLWVPLRVCRATVLACWKSNIATWALGGGGLWLVFRTLGLVIFLVPWAHTERNDANHHLLVSPVSRKSAWQNLGPRSEIGGECRRFWAWIFFWGGTKLLQKQGRKIRGKNLPSKFAEKLAGNFLKVARPKKFTPNPKCRTSGSTLGMPSFQKTKKD